MSDLSSFYGGRQGASFVIVKKFDGIDIPEKSVYRQGCFAKDTQGYFIVPLVEKNVNNYASYPAWDYIPKDGVTTVTSQSGVVSIPLPVEYAEGMKQCFEQGGITVSEVGYGEYVIIDTIFGIDQYNNPDNGKVYRRGMNYDSDLGGAEYIGQIVGPQGHAPKLDMTTVEDVLEHLESQVREYDMTEGDAQDGIVPGKYIDTYGAVGYNDKITYSWATLRDVNGNITGALIGFTFPYLISEFSSNMRSAYYTQDDYITGRISDLSLIGTSIKNEDNFTLFVDNGFDTPDRDPEHGDTGHAFYRRWHLTIPQGIKGDAQTQLEIVPTKIRPNANLWGSVDITQPPVSQADNDTYVILSDSKFNKDCVYPYDDASAIVLVEKRSAPGVEYYAKIEDTYMLKIRYRQTNYDEHENGSDYQIIDLGNYNTIRKVWLESDGYLWVSYNADDDSIVNEGEPIQWYENVNVLNNGTIVFTYNTLKSDGFTHNTQEFEEAIDWLESVALANKNNPSRFDPKGTNVNSGHFRVIFNNDSVANKTGTWTDAGGIDHAIWETDITWPQAVSLDANGLLKFLYNNNLYYDQSIYTNPNEGSYNFEIPWITNAFITQDGTFTLTYNNNRSCFRKVESSETFDASISYYKEKEDILGQYVVDPTVNASNFNSKVAAGLYIVKESWNIESNSYTKSLNFVDHVTIDEDGAIHFWYSNGTEADNTQYANIRIKYLSDVRVRTGLNPASQYDFDGEGTEDQKIGLVWNTETVPGVKDESVIGAPLNYVMETIVTGYDPNAPDTPQNHLLVLYSDPAYRQWLINKYKTTDKNTNKIWSYTSQKFTQQDPMGGPDPVFVTRDDWFDLGYVKGEPGGLHIIGEYTLTSGQTYKTYLTDGVPPEDMPGNTPEDRGWAYLITKMNGSIPERTIYTYDYVHDKWTIVSGLSNAVVDPSQVIIVDESKIDPATGKIIPKSSEYETLPQDKGLWFVKKQVKIAY